MTASSVYVKAKTKSAQEVGIKIIDHHLEESTSQADLLELIDILNKQKNVNGILVQLPLPKHICERDVIESISVHKDVFKKLGHRYKNMQRGQDSEFNSTLLKKLKLKLSKTN